VTALATNAFLLTIAQSTTNSISFSFPQCNITSFEGPNISDADLMKINMTLLATGTLANEVITVANDYAFNYATGVAL
jgi:hypothetical protein